MIVGILLCLASGIVIAVTGYEAIVLESFDPDDFMYLVLNTAFFAFGISIIRKAREK